MHEQVQDEVLDEVVHVVAKTLPIEGVKQRVTGPISDSASSMSLTAFPEFQGLSAESALVDFTFVRTTEGATYGDNTRYS